MLKKKTAKKGLPGLTEYTEKMVAALAHEIRNPLNSMKGAAEFINDKYGVTPEVKEFSGIILNEIKRVENYLNEFLSFSRGIKLKISRVNLKSYITGVIMTVKHSFPYEIQVETGKADGEIEFDSEQIRQVLVNLLANAKEAVNKRLPEKPIVSVSAILGKKTASIIVTDNGCGMNAEELKNIFVPFYTTREDGMGIGLAVCRSIAQRHAGRIKVKTTKGAGSVFKLELPVKQKKGKHD